MGAPGYGRYTTVLDDPRIFWDRVLIGDSCWEWQGERSPLGYGRTKAAGKRWMAHRLAYYLWYAQHPGDLNVCHHCDNPSCVRPDHLWLGTQGDNLRDAFRKGRKQSPQACKTHCNAGHPLTGANLYIAPTGQRVCRQCHRVSHRALYWKNRTRKRGPYPMKDTS